MLFHDKRLYRTALNAKLGKDRSPKLLRDLKSWIEEQYSISVVLLKYDTIDIGPNAGRPRLNVIVETDQDHSVIHQDWLTLEPQVASGIRNRFSLLVAESGSSAFCADDVHLIADNFSDEAMRISTAEFLEAEHDRIVKEFSKCGLWTLTSISREIVAFFYTDKQIREARQNGCVNELTDYCCSHISSYDRFNYFSRDIFPIRFDSKENLDDNCQGNWYYYFK